MTTIKRVRRQVTALVFLCLLMLGAATTAQSQNPPDRKQQDATVYVTRTGAKYHRDGVSLSEEQD